jgi:dUTP pyrophosphatase
MDPTLVHTLADKEKKKIQRYPVDYIRLEYKLVDLEARVPYRKRETDAGYDIFSIEDVVIKPHSTENIKTGIIVVCPQGYYLVVEGRSSMWVNGVAPFHGILDTGYSGQLFVRLMNISDVDYHVKKHDRIAQIIIHKAHSAVFVEVDEFSYNQRGEKGFGSSGR